MPILSDDIKTFIVKGLACFDTPSEVAEAVKVNFGIEVTRQQVHAYDPACAQKPAPRWCELHAAAREAFLQDTAGIAITHRAYRLRLLDRMMRDALRYNYFERVAAFMEQAAKECGGIYDRRERAAKASHPAAAAMPQGHSERAPERPSAEDSAACSGEGRFGQPGAAAALPTAPCSDPSAQH